jgi:hypothetical protein
LALALAAAPAARAAFGELEVLQGEVIVTKAQLEVRGQAGTRIALDDGDRIRSLDNARARITMSGKTLGVEAILGPRSTLTVNEQLVARRVSPFLLVYGAIRARAARFFSGLPLVATTTATVGVKGTDFITYVIKPNASEFIGIAGLIEAVDRSNPANRLLIGHRQWGEIVKGVPPKPPIRVPDEQWFQALRDFAFPE